ncbi:protein of unknown function [Tardiphaga sp. OK246]|jgi:hypothetical protein|uniref:Abi-alpha family protein n=1 Tax=Tardiphaga sp. OK246 TaxID=1855307 RepID=UPI000B646AAF|nr:Abi-alpha family protein [Tardiphaga sp. OK246]SNT09870.1 protein of unknown function [Tardiphaga sp. OK246]
MSDNPYEKSIEEGAKAAGKFLDVVKSVSPAVGDLYGLAIGDRVHGWRQRHIDAVTRKTKRILEERDVEAQEIPEQIALPLIEAAQGEPREELQDLYARLLANAMDPASADNVRPEFIQTVKELQPIDLRILLGVSTYKSPNEQLPLINEISKGLDLREAAAALAIANLERLSCVRRVGGGQYLALSEYGREFLIAVKA